MIDRHSSSNEAPSIRRFTPGMESDLRAVFYSAVREGCMHDYSPEQLAAWAPDDYDQQSWDERLHELRPFVAMLGSRIVGYADLQESGYIDQFYVHGQHQHQGIGQALMKSILHAGRGKRRLYLYVSRTARPFFERKGFIVVESREVERRGVTLQNYFMERVQAKA